MIKLEMQRILKEHERGNTFDTLEFRLKVNGEVVDLTGASILIDFKNPQTGQKKTMTTNEGGGLIINDPIDGVFSITEQIIDWPIGQWKFAVTYTLSSGKVKTWITGVLPIIDRP